MLSVCWWPELWNMQSAFALSPSVASLSVPYFSTLSHKRHDFRGKNVTNTKCVFWFSLQFLSETFLILRRIHRDIIININNSSCKVPVTLVRFLMKLKFVDRFSKNTLNFMKIRPVGAELLNADGDTELINLIVSSEVLQRHVKWVTCLSWFYLAQ